MWLGVKTWLHYLNKINNSLEKYNCREVYKNE
nr:MAG TPA: hypothetical protein [Caudoviricetes sp.]